MQLLLCLLVLSLAAICGLALYLNHKMQTKWMRAFCVQQQINPRSMEDEREEAKTPLTNIPRRRISVPIPGAWRDSPPKQVTKQ
jgi:hypothetical protein